MKKWFLVVILNVLMLTDAWSQPYSVAGLWKNIDDHTGKAKALIRVVEKNGEFIGYIDKLYIEDGEDINPRCIKCDGIYKNQFVIGMTILFGMKQDGEVYTGGQIMDPDNGEIYKCKLTLFDSGKKLNVRGFVGLTLFGRSQTWLREE